MAYGFPAGLFFAQFVFGLFFINNKLIYKVFMSAIISMVIFFLNVYLKVSDLSLSIGIDIYGVWSFMIGNALISLAIWEAYYFAERKLK